jgi:hypothetical protein
MFSYFPSGLITLAAVSWYLLLLQIYINICSLSKNFFRFVQGAYAPMCQMPNWISVCVSMFHFFEASKYRFGVSEKTRCMYPQLTLIFFVTHFAPGCQTCSCNPSVTTYKHCSLVERPQEQPSDQTKLSFGCLGLARWLWTTMHVQWHNRGGDGTAWWLPVVRSTAPVVA